MWTVYDCVSFLANVPSLPKLVRILGWGSYFGGLNLNSKPNTFCMYLLQEISPQASAKGWRISAKLVIFASFLQSKFLKVGKVKKTNQQLIVFDQIFSPTLNVLWVYLCTNHSDSCRCFFSCLQAPRLRRTEPLGTEGSSGSNHMTLPRPPLGQKKVHQSSAICQVLYKQPSSRISPNSPTGLIRGTFQGNPPPLQWPIYIASHRRTIQMSRWANSMPTPLPSNRPFRPFPVFKLPTYHPCRTASSCVASAEDHHLAG